MTDSRRKPNRRFVPILVRSLGGIALGIVYWSYWRRFTEQGHDEFTNLFLAPLVWGSMGYVVFPGSGIGRVISVAVISLIALLLIFGEGDPAKPGITNVIAASMTAISVLGAAVAGGVIAAARLLRHNITKR